MLEHDWSIEVEGIKWMGGWLERPLDDWYFMDFLVSKCFVLSFVDKQGLRDFLSFEIGSNETKKGKTLGMTMESLHGFGKEQNSP